MVQKKAPRVPISKARRQIVNALALERADRLRPPQQKRNVLVASVRGQCGIRTKCCISFLFYSLRPLHPLYLQLKG